MQLCTPIDPNLLLVSIINWHGKKSLGESPHKVLEVTGYVPRGRSNTCYRATPTISHHSSPLKLILQCKKRGTHGHRYVLRVVRVVAGLGISKPTTRGNTSSTPSCSIELTSNLARERLSQTYLTCQVYYGTHSCKYFQSEAPRRCSAIAVLLLCSLFGYFLPRLTSLASLGLCCLSVGLA